MLEKNKANVLAIIDSCSKISAYTNNISSSEELFDNQLVFDAVLMNFIVIGESVSKLTDDFKSDNSNITWQKIQSFRNIVAHNYFGVDAEEVLQIVQSDILILIKDLEAILFEK